MRVAANRLITIIGWASLGIDVTFLSIFVVTVIIGPHTPASLVWAYIPFIAIVVLFCSMRILISVFHLTVLKSRHEWRRGY